MDWTKIYYAQDEIEANMIGGLLKSHEIPAKIVPKSSGSILKSPLFYTNSNIPYEIFVPETDREKAEKILSSSNDVSPQ